MQRTVNGKQSEFLIQCNVVRVCLPQGGVHGDHYVAQDGGHSRQDGRDGRTGQLFRLRERKHVGGLVLAAPVPVQGVNRAVIGQQNAYLRAGVVFRLEQTAHGLPQHRRSYRMRLLVAYTDGHSGSPARGR